MLSKQEEALLKVLREIRYGRHDWVIFMEDGQPVRIEQREGTRSIKL